MSDEEALRALVVEDDPDDVAIFRRYAEQLREYRLNLIHAATGEEVAKRFAPTAFDIVFIDLQLGGATGGIDLIEHLARQGWEVPAVVVTGTGDENKAVEAMKAGAYDYLVKDSLNRDLLERTVRNVRRRHLLEQEREEMMCRLEELSVTDELTSLANRRRFDERLQEEVERCARTGSVFALLMMDLDHFKQVNDQHGHQTGDEVLQKCARALEEHIRRTDFPARYGGEEFCVILPETSLQGALVAAEKLRKAVEDLRSPVPTVSIGVGCWEPDLSADELLHCADEALYAAKDSGRNAVVVLGEG